MFWSNVLPPSSWHQNLVQVDHGMIWGKKWVSFIGVLEGVKLFRIMERIKGIDFGLV
jgi:hypothetical protein